MKRNRFKDVLAAGGRPVGHMIMEFTTRGIAKMVESADLDFVLLDMEHTAADAETIADVIAWLKATPVAPFVRVPQSLYHFIARTMDAGALGIMVANVESAEQAKSVVNAVKYAPLGNRGVGLGTAHTDYVAPDPVKYFEQSNANTTIICQIESVTGVRNAEAIAAVEGVDVLWVGHFDLTQSMGIPAQFAHPQFRQALQQVVAAAKRHNRALGIQPGNWEMAEEWIKLGFNAISWSSDIAVYRAALAEAIQKLRERSAATAAQ